MELAAMKHVNASEVDAMVTLNFIIALINPVFTEYFIYTVHIKKDI
jgi:hypothetical protein